MKYNIHEKSLIVWANTLPDADLKRALDIQIEFNVERNINILKNILRKRKLIKLK